MELAKENKINADKPVVIFASNIEDKAFAKPSSIAATCFLPFIISSLILSYIRTFASTRIPIVNTIPAIPGNVKTAPRPERIPKYKEYV